MRRSRWRDAPRTKRVPPRLARPARTPRTCPEIGRSCSRRCLQSFLQAQQTVANPALHRAERLLQRLRNFGVRQSFKIRELDRLSLLRVQEAYQRTHFFRPALLVKFLLELRRSRNQGRQLFRLFFAAALALAFQAKRIQRAIAGECEQPGNERPARGVVPLGVAPEQQEYILYHFFRGAGVLQDAQNKAVYRPRMAVVELLERAHVLLKKPVYERRIG